MNIQCKYLPQQVLKNTKFGGKTLFFLVIAMESEYISERPQGSGLATGAFDTLPSTRSLTQQFKTL